MSAKGPSARDEAIAGEPIKGSWWGHAKLLGPTSAVAELVTESKDIHPCRLVDGKVTLCIAAGLPGDLLFYLHPIR